MKNFIFVINKEKIYAYILSICTIVALFFMSSFLHSDFDETEITSSNIAQNTINNEVSNNDN